MKKIVLSTVFVIAESVILYRGGSSPVAMVAASVVCFVALGVIFAVAQTAGTTFAFAVAVAIVVRGTPDFPSFAVIIFFLLAFCVNAVAEQERVKPKWAALAFAMEGLAIWGAFAVGDLGWSAAIALGGIVVLLAIGYSAPSLSREEERALIAKLIDPLERELKGLRERLAELDSPG